MIIASNGHLPTTGLFNQKELYIFLDILVKKKSRTMPVLKKKIF
jgi:hypothetical protein